MLLLVTACSTAPMDSSSPVITAPEETPLLYLNEFVAERDDGGDWVELYNPGTLDVSLDGYWLTDEHDPAVIPTGLTVPARGYLVLGCGGATVATDADLTFRLDKDGDEISLWRSDDDADIAVDSVIWDQYVPAAARVPDGAASWVVGGSPSPGTSNG